MPHEVFDQQALEALFVSQQARVFNVVCRRTWSRDDAAEIVQEAFGRLWDMRRRVDPARARPLLFRIALNLAASHRRWHKIRAFVRIGDQPGAESLEDHVLAEERRRAVGRALDDLPEKLRRSLLLTELSDLSYAEIAEAEGTRPGTVGSRRNAALARLRASLQPETEEATTDGR